MPSIIVRSGNLLSPLMKKMDTNNSTVKEARLQQHSSRVQPLVRDLSTTECPTRFGDEQTSARRGSDMQLKDTPSTVINSNLVYYKNTRTSITSICIIKTTVQCNSEGAT